MMNYIEIGDTIKGNRIIVEAGKISDIIIITSSGRNKIERVAVKNNAICYIDKRIRSLK